MNLEKLQCKVCGHAWTPRVVDPVECPACKSRKWNEEKIKNTTRTKHIMVSEQEPEQELNLKDLLPKL